MWWILGRGYPVHLWKSHMGDPSPFSALPSLTFDVANFGVWAEQESMTELCPDPKKLPATKVCCYSAALWLHHWQILGIPIKTIHFNRVWLMSGCKDNKIILLAVAMVTSLSGHPLWDDQHHPFYFGLDHLVSLVGILFLWRDKTTLYQRGWTLVNVSDPQFVQKFLHCFSSFIGLTSCGWWCCLMVPLHYHRELVNVTTFSDNLQVYRFNNVTSVDKMVWQLFEIYNLPKACSVEWKFKSHIPPPKKKKEKQSVFNVQCKK